MDHLSSLIWVLVVVVLVGASFYPPLGALVSEGVRVLIGLGASVGVVYFAFRHPWRAAQYVVALAILIGSVFVAYFVNISWGIHVAMIGFWVAFYVACRFLGPLLQWFDSKDRETKQKKS